MPRVLTAIRITQFEDDGKSIYRQLWPLVSIGIVLQANMCKILLDLSCIYDLRCFKSYVAEWFEQRLGLTIAKKMLRMEGFPEEGGYLDIIPCVIKNWIISATAACGGFSIVLELFC